MKLNVIVNIRERFAYKRFYASKSISAVIRKPGKTWEVGAYAYKLLVFFKPKNTEGVVAMIYHHFYANRV